MPCRPRPETGEEPQRRDSAQRLRAIERWLQHADEELLYAPDAQGEAATTSLDARYYLRWGGGCMGLLAILRFPLDARHSVAQKPYGAYAVGEVFPLTYQGQLYEGRVIERLVSRAEGLVELHVQATLGEEGGPLNWPPSADAVAGNGLRPAPTQSRQEHAPSDEPR